MWRGVCATDPEVIAKTLARHAPGLVGVVIETGPLSVFLYHGLAERDVRPEKDWRMEVVPNRWQPRKG